MMATVVAIDLGASSGRVLRGVFDGERLTLEECSRFPNGPVALPGPASAGGAGAGKPGGAGAGKPGGGGADGSERSEAEAGVAYEWDILALWRGILDGLREASLRGSLDAIGIDTWAVDYGLLDEDGRLIGNPDGTPLGCMRAMGCNSSLSTRCSSAWRTGGRRARTARARHS